MGIRNLSSNKPTVSASDNVKFSANTQRIILASSYTLAKKFVCGYTGNYRLKCQYRVSGSSSGTTSIKVANSLTTYGEISTTNYTTYQNISVDVFCFAGDFISVFVKNDSGFFASDVANCTIGYDINADVASAVVTN